MVKSEEEGFEPPLPLLVNLFSKQTQSATLPLFQKKSSRVCQIPGKTSSLSIFYNFRYTIRPILQVFLMHALLEAFLFPAS